MGDNLGNVNIMISIIGVIYLSYSLLCRNKVTFYNQSSRMIILNQEKFLQLQLYFSIINSIFLIIIGLVLTIFNLGIVYTFASIGIFHIINVLLRIVAKNKSYIQFKKYKFF